MQMHMEIQMQTQNADDDRGHQLERARLVFLSTVSDAKIALMQFASFSGLHSSPPPLETSVFIWGKGAKSASRMSNCVYFQTEDLHSGKLFKVTLFKGKN